MANSYIETASEQSEFLRLIERVEISVVQKTFAVETDKPLDVLPQYKSLYAQNSDFGGWVKIENTKLNFPVMYTPVEPEKYLRRAFDKSYSLSGVPFVGEGGSLYPRSDNVVLYGHNMTKGTMFATLLSYKNKEFWKEHPEVQFDTLYEKGTYQIFAVLQIDIEQAEGLRCYSFIQAQSSEDFDIYVEDILNASLYDTKIIPKYSDQILTLSTCAYHVEGGRFVIVARKVD